MRYKKSSTKFNFKLLHHSDDFKSNNVYEDITFLDESSDKHIFGWGFKRDEVHAILAADVSALQPIDLIINFTKLYGD